MGAYKGNPGAESQSGQGQENTAQTSQKSDGSYGSYSSYGSDSVKDRDLVPMYSFPFHILPKELREIIERISTALHVEPEVIASLTLALISGALGNTIRVSPKNGYEVPLFIWFIIIAQSGYGKTPTFNILTKAIKDSQARAYKKYKEELDEYNELISDRKKGDELPAKPKLDQYLVSDTTVEALANVFESTPRGIIINQDEIAGLIYGLDQYKKGRGNDRQRYIELFDCQPWKTDRKTESRFIPNTGASIIGGIQPPNMTKVFTTDSFWDGFLPRFLLVNAENKPLKYSREEIKEDDLAYWKNLLNWCYNIPLELDDNRFVKPKVLTLSSKGVDLWASFYNDYGNIVPYLSDRARVFIPKLLAYCLKFMGILHVIKTFSNQGTLEPIINKETVADAIKLTRYFAGQAIKTLELYQPQGSKVNEFQKGLIDTLYVLKDEVKNGKLPLSRIVEFFNSQLPDKLKHSPENISHLLKSLNLTTQKSTGNLSVLLWDQNKIEDLFHKITVPTVTSVTLDALIPLLIAEQDSTQARLVKTLEKQLIKKLQVDENFPVENFLLVSGIPEESKSEIERLFEARKGLTSELSMELDVKLNSGLIGYCEKEIRRILKDSLMLSQTSDESSLH